MSGLIIASIILTLVYGFAFAQKLVYRRFWNRSLSYRMTFSRTAAFEGERIIISDCITNNKILPLPWLLISYRIPLCFTLLNKKNEKISRGELRNHVFVMRPKKIIRQEYQAICDKRGVYPLSAYSLSSNNLLMTESKYLELDLRYTITVYPKLVEYPDSLIPINRISGDIIAKRFINPDPFTFKGIREYQPHDSFKQINYKATAKACKLMSNIYDFTVSQEVIVLLNLQEYNEYIRDFVHEEAIRLAAFLCRRCIEAGITVSLVCPSPGGEPQLISNAFSKTQLEIVYTALAGINLNVINHSIADFIPASREQYCVIISSYHGDDLQKKFKEQKENGGNLMWVVPMCERDEINVEGEGITKWEVQRDAKV